MNSNVSIIEKSSFHFHYSHKKKAERCNGILESIFDTHLFPEIKKGTENIDHGFGNWEINQLEIDLGSIREEDFSEKLGDKIRLALESALMEAIKKQMLFLSHPNWVSHELLKWGYLESMFYYLQNGFFPVWMDSKINLRLIVDYLLNVHPKELALMIKKRAINEDSKKRLVFGLTSSVFDKILGILEPAEADWIIEFRSTWMASLKNEVDVKLNTDEIGRSINFFILQFILDESGSRFNKIIFSESVLKKTARHYNLNYNLFLQDLVNIIASIKMDSLIYQRFLETLQAVQKLNVNEMQPPEKTEESKEDFCLNLLNQFSFVQIKDHFASEGLGEFKALIKAFPDTNRFLSKLSVQGLYHLIMVLSHEKPIEADTFIKKLLDLKRDISGFDSSETDLRSLVWQALTSKIENASIKMDNLFWFELFISELDPESYNWTDREIKRLWEFGNKEKIPHTGVFLPKILRLQSGFNSKGNPYAIFNPPYIPDEHKFQEANKEITSLQVKNLILHYFNFGTLPHAFYALSKTEIRQVLLNAVSSGESLFVDLILQSKMPMRLLNLILPLIEPGDIPEYTKYLNQRFEGVLTAFLNLKGLSIPASNQLLGTWEFFNQFLAGIIRSKGNIHRDIFRFHQTQFHWFYFTQEIKRQRIIDASQGKREPEFGDYLAFYQELVHCSGFKEKRLLEELFWYSKIWGRNLVLLQPKEIKGQSIKFTFPSGLDAIHKTIALRGIRTKNLFQRLFGTFQQPDEALIRRFLIDHQNTALNLLISSWPEEISKSGLQSIKLRGIVKTSNHWFNLDPQFLKSIIQNHPEVALQIMVLFKWNLPEAPWNFFLKNLIDWGLPSFVRDFIRDLKLQQLPLDGQKSKISIQNGAFHTDHSIGEVVFKPTPKAKWKGITFSLIWNKLFIHKEAKLDKMADNNLSSGNPTVPKRDLWEWKGSTTDKPYVFKVLFQGLLFWTEKGYLPWWSKTNHLKAMLLDLVTMVENEDEKEKDMLEMLLVDAGFLRKVVLELKIDELKHIYFLFQEVKLVPDIPDFKQVLLSIRPDENFGEATILNLRRDTFSKNQKIFLPDNFKNVDSRIWLNAYQKDPLLLEKTIYSQSDEFMLSKFFFRDDRIKGQVEALLGFAPYLFFGNLTGFIWRKLVYTFALQFYVLGKKGFSENYDAAFLSFLTKKYTVYNWKLAFQSVYQKTTANHSGLALSKAFISNLGLENLTTANKGNGIKMENGIRVRVSNAGLVLTWPYLTMLFDRLGYLDKGKFIGQEAQFKAAYLLQYMAYDRIDFAEYELVLNKLLVGLPPSVHLVPGWLPSGNEKELARSLMTAMLENWGKLKNSTIEAMQETFFQRNGILLMEDIQVTLKVDPKGVDVLLASMNWSFQMVKLPWMQKVIQVEWNSGF